jgi:deoxyribonuclease V
MRPEAMIACLDVAYDDMIAYAGGLIFREWTDASPVQEQVMPVVGVQQPYQSGQFFRRELPCLLAILRALPPVEVVIVDGYVWLGDVSQPGLGAHLHQALDGQAAVVGVAKTKFQAVEVACEVFRGRSTRPLFITAAGMSPESAAEHVRSMHGASRVPTLLQRVDALCRQARAGEVARP